MASKKAQQARANSLSIEVVSNGYKVKGSGKSSGGFVSLVCGSGGVITTSSDEAALNGEFVFQDFAGLVSFLRKRLSVPSA